jgi:hypothetical protein
VHFALVHSGGIANDFVPGADEHGSVVPEAHIAIVHGRDILCDFVTGANEQGSVISEVHFAVVHGSGVTDYFVPQLNRSHRLLLLLSVIFDCISSLKGASLSATIRKPFCTTLLS